MTRADDSTKQAAESHQPGIVRPTPGPTSAAPNSASADLPAFHSDDVENVADYRSLSVLALISLLLGIASLLYIVSNVFFILPLAGIALSLLALQRIGASEGRLAGRWAAITGLVLCVACGATTLTRGYVVRHLRSAKAREFAAAWLTQLVSSETELAFKNTYDGVRPMAPAEPGRPTPAKTPYETFLSDPLIQKISAAGKDAAIQYVGTLEFIPATRQEAFVRQQFRIVPGGSSANSGSTDAFDAYLTLQRSRFRGDSHPRWLIVRYEPANVPAAK